jgi:hypothetical protein
VPVRGRVDLVPQNCVSAGIVLPVGALHLTHIKGLLKESRQ